MSDTYGSTAIIGNDYHTGILFEGKVYNNIHKTGILFANWIKDFYSADGIKVLQGKPF